MIRLPIDDILPSLLETVGIHQNIILHAPPGAGKTTRVPLALISSPAVPSGRIIMLEPRRIAAVSAARWMASCLGEEVGQTVGYSIRFDSCTSAATRIEVVTEGILTRRIQSDPGLAGVALVIFDEFHERSIHADLGLALCREVQQLRGDLKIMVMSATLDLEPLVRLLENAPVISSAGRSYDVEMKYLDDRSTERLPRKMMAAVVRALQETTGDILAFLPGSGEIRTCASLLAETGLFGKNIDLCQLYGDLPVAEQQKVMQPGVRRKVVLATSIAESSLTIEGVTTVIDSGVSRRLQYDPGNGLNRLVTVRESRASAEQRAGRAGRTAPGVCYRLFTQHTLHAMAPHTPPEICVTDLSQLVLELAAWGVSDPLQLGWLDAPPAAAQDAARRLLVELDLFDDSGRITPDGREVVRVPLHPRLGRLLLRSRELRCPALGCRIAALLSERDLFRTGVGGGMRSSGSDVADRLEALHAWRTSGRADHRMDPAAIKNVERVCRQLERLMSVSGADKQGFYDDDLISRLLVAAYPDRIARRRESGSDGYLLISGRGARISERSGVRRGDYIVAPALDAGHQAEAVIHLAAEISESVIREERARHIFSETDVSWDDREGRVIGRRCELLGSLQLSAGTVVPPVALAVPAVIGAVRASALSLLTMDEAARQLQGRLTLLHMAFPEREWPDVSDPALLDSLEEWLAPHLDGVTSAKRLARLDIVALLRQRLDYRRQRELDDLAPTHLSVPSGSRVKIDYTGEIPVLAVKLQELFGLATGPTVCDGRISVLLHLLSPAGRPIQVTRDLRGFWDGSYQQVKKELKGRYPRHPWPDDPWSAVPTRRVKPRV
ncbi:MAG: ATP-dependent helicase HrpB [Geobacteraceae bacterium GWC2_53_11]|nr:MAG: ATP-dependent helicase HrpB [Geobacteraceae bacterium GWC2_53_11]